MTTYYLLKEVHEILRVDREGNLYCVDGRDVKEYLRERFKDIPDDTPMAILPSQILRHLNDVAWLVPQLSLAA